MGIKIKNLQTGEFEKFNIPALKGEKGEPGEIEPSEKVDYIGKQHSKLRDTMNANVDYIIKTAIGEFNYLDYEGQHITATNSIEGHARSAFLSGQTKYQIGEFIQDVYVPVQKFKSGYYLGFNDGTLIQGGNEHKYCEDYIPLPTGVTSITSKGSNNWKKLCCYDSNKNFISGVNGTAGLEDLTLNIPSNAKYFRYSTNTAQGKNEYINVVSNNGLLLASSNYNIPCELISCKMPVLTTVGKNLVDLSTSIYGEGYNNVQTDFIKINPNKTFIASMNNQYGSTVTFYTQNKEPIITINGFKVTSPSNAYYLRWVISTQDRTADWNSFQIEEGSVVTPYEPHKSNILSTPSDLELRGIGDVKDILDCLSGEVTERIGEIVLDGSENWILEYNKENTIAFYTNDIPNKLNSTTSVSDKFTYRTDSLASYDFECIKNAIGFYINISKNRLPSENVNGLKTYLQSNPITVQYQLATKSIKTVDLSDNHVYSYKDTTHYTCSSAEGSLVPTLSVKVPTDTQLTIQEQKATTQTLLIKNMDLQQSIKEVQAMNLAFNTALYNSFNSIREEVEDIKKHVSTNENLEGSF